MAGTRTTRQREAIRAVLRDTTEFRTAQHLHAQLQRDGESVGLATVYRYLALLGEIGEVDTIRRDDGESLYRRCSEQHHHHLVCRTCGRTVEVTGPAVERWAEAVGAEHGFCDVSHQVELFGECRQCRKHGQHNDHSEQGEHSERPPEVGT